MIIEIKKTGINGEGIGYIDKVPVFVNGALIDEIVDISIIGNNKNYKIGRLNRIVKESKERVKPICENYYRCNGCGLMHTTYANQLEIKKELLREALLKYADIDEYVEIEASEKEFNYRNCLKLPFVNHYGKLALGVYEENSNYICAINSCLIHSELLERLKNEVLDILNRNNLSIYDRKTKKGLKHLVLREIGNRAHMCLITGEDSLSKKVIEELNSIKEIVSIYQCVNTSRNNINIFSNKMIHLAGGKHLVFKIDNLKFNLSIKSFFQLNTNQAKKLYRYVINKLEDNENLIVEAYSGIGAMSLLAKDKAKEIVGIEYVNDAVVNGNVNANINHIDNVKFICGDAAEVLNRQFKKRRIDTLIVDPPRSGLDDKMIEAIENSNINRIIYISCNPATLAKNINVLLRKYEIEDMKAFDMFPQTSHVEVVVSFIKK